MNLFLLPSIPLFYSCVAHSSAYSPAPAASVCTHASAAPALLSAAGTCSPACQSPTAHGCFRSLDLPPRGWSWPPHRLPALQHFPARRGISAWVMLCGLSLGFAMSRGFWGPVLAISFPLWVQGSSRSGPFPAVQGLPWGRAVSQAPLCAYEQAAFASWVCSGTWV